MGLSTDWPISYENRRGRIAESYRSSWYENSDRSIQRNDKFIINTQFQLLQQKAWAFIPSENKDNRKIQ